jgi:hypothetical protein
MKLFLDPNHPKSSSLDQFKTLEELGFSGSTSYEDAERGVEKTIIFFDYAIVTSDCPILNSDFYFHDYKASSSSVVNRKY